MHPFEVLLVHLSVVGLDQALLLGESVPVFLARCDIGIVIEHCYCKVLPQVLHDITGAGSAAALFLLPPPPTHDNIASAAAAYGTHDLAADYAGNEQGRSTA